MAGKRNVLGWELLERLQRTRCRREGGHLVWLGARDSRGNAFFRAGGRVVMVRRFFFGLVVRPLGPGERVFRLCGERRCVDPGHAGVGRLPRLRCRRGHLFTEASTVWLRSGKRTCRICLNENKRLRKQVLQMRAEQARVEEVEGG